MKIPHISISREQSFNQCKLYYHYKYDLDLKSPKEQVWFTYGKVIHKFIETYTNSKGTLPVKTIITDILSGKIPIDEKNKPISLPASYHAKIPKHIGSFLKLTEEIGFSGEVESEFNVDIEPPNNKIFKGIIDRLIEVKGKYFIIDYKTTQDGPYRKTQETIGKDLQMLSYTRIIQKKHNIPAENITASLYYLENSERVEAQFSQEALDAVEPRLLQTYNTISSIDGEKVCGTTGGHCDRCEYRAICPYYANYKFSF